MSSPNDAVSIVVPTLDEFEGARALLQDADRWKSPWPFELVFVDGGSVDGTTELLRSIRRPWLRSVHLRRDQDLAAAWRAGLDAARGDIRVTMDADGVHTFDGVERLVDAVLKGADLAIARRYGPEGTGMPGRTWSARLASWAAARAFSLRYGLRLHDPLHGLRARSARAYSELRLRLSGVQGNVYLGCEALLAVQLGHEVTELPIHYGQRLAGKDKKRLGREGLRLVRALADPIPRAGTARPAPGEALAVAPPSPLDLRVLSHFSEIREIRRGGMPAPRTAIIYPTYGCNLHCPSCEYAMDNERDPAQLPLQRWKSLLTELAVGGTKGVELCGGGEPLLHPGVVEAVLHGAGKGLRFGVLTNGTWLPPRFLTEALPHCAYVRVTIDAATAATYAKVRPAQGQVLWPRVIENVQRLLAARRPETEVSLKFLVSQPNRHEIGAAVELARKLGVSSIQFKAARETPTELTEAQATEVEHEIEAARRRAAPFRVLGGVRKLVMRRACELSPLQTTIDPRGDVFMCCYYSQRRVRHRIGNVLDQPFGEIWGSPRHREVIAGVQQAECSNFDCRFVRYHDVLDAWEGAHGDGLAFI